MPAVTEHVPGIYYADIDESDLDDSAEVTITGLPAVVELLRAKLFRKDGTSTTIQPILANATGAASGDEKVEAEAASAAARWDEITGANPVVMYLPSGTLYIQPQFTGAADNQLVGQIILRRLDAPRMG
jgi:hypothetical protein